MTIQKTVIAGVLHAEKPQPNHKFDPLRLVYQYVDIRTAKTPNTVCIIPH